MLMEYALGDDRSYLWVVTKNKVSTYELPGRAEIEKAVRRFHDVLTANQPKINESYAQHVERVRQANEQLRNETAVISRLILAPMASELAGNTRRLLVVADGALQFIPFQVLTLEHQRSDGGESSEGDTPLIVDHEIINEPSASALSVLMSANADGTKAPENTLAMFADPVFEADDPRITSRIGATTRENAETSEVERSFRDVDPSTASKIPRLLASRDEAENVLALVPRGRSLKALGFDASRDLVTRSDLSNYHIIHFATHGLLNNEHPELSGIVLSLFNQRGEPQPGFLRLYDIYNLKLRADLVVLSACNTALGKEVRGEGLVGLTRGFMYAGASGVVASLWKVDDDATAELMKQFYRGMFQDKLTPAAALRQAQLSLKKQKRWQEPYYWAGFILQGRHNHQIDVSPSYSIRPAIVIGLGVLAASLAMLFALRRRFSF
jgi:CHAT domain-containing protein